jgi:uncharacterized protein YehS (DUF1456 family)
LVLSGVSAEMVVRFPDPTVLALVAAGVALALSAIISYLIIVATMTKNEGRRAAAERVLDRLLLAGLLRRRRGHSEQRPREPPESHARANRVKSAHCRSCHRY